MAKTASELNTQRLYDLLMPSTEAPEALPYDAPAEEMPEVSISNEKLEALRQRMTTAASPALSEPGDGIVLVNLTEALVADKLDAAFDKFNCCRCDRCRKRAAAFALNDLPPNYVAARMDQIEELLSVCPTKDAAAAVVRAVLRVKATPEH
ncbi:MAG: hypothetical protein HDT26_09965 [Subdoligranulum sp.]|nr:hypothetical protein [Subdoligranulum sp.]